VIFLLCLQNHIHIHYKWLLNIPNNVFLYYLIKSITYKTYALFFLFFLDGDRHIFTQKTQVVGKIEIDIAILLKLWIYK